MKKNYDTPHIREIYIDDNHHLIVENSEGDYHDNGYLPTDGITIHYKEDKENERRHKARSYIAMQDKAIEFGM